LPRRRLTEPIELHARTIHTTRTKGLEVSRERARNLDLPLREHNAVNEGVRIVPEDRSEHVPPFLCRGVSRLTFRRRPDAEHTVGSQFIAKAYCADDAIFAYALATLPIPLARLLFSSAEKVGRCDAVAF